MIKIEVTVNRAKGRPKTKGSNNIRHDVNEQVRFGRGRHPRWLKMEEVQNHDLASWLGRAEEVELSLSYDASIKLHDFVIQAFCYQCMLRKLSKFACLH